MTFQTHQTDPDSRFCVKTLWVVLPFTRNDTQLLNSYPFPVRHLSVSAAGPVESTAKISDTSPVEAARKAACSGSWLSSWGPQIYTTYSLELQHPMTISSVGRVGFFSCFSTMAMGIHNYQAYPGCIENLLHPSRIRWWILRWDEHKCLPLEASARQRWDFDLRPLWHRLKSPGDVRDVRDVRKWALRSNQQVQNYFFDE